MRLLFLLLIPVLTAAAAPGLDLLWRVRVPGESFTGAAAEGSALFTWGRAAYLWSGRTPREIARAPHGYDDGGCALDGDLILAERPASGTLGRLVRLAAPGFAAETIDTDVELHDCLPATLFGRRGFLMIHRFAQIRFYWREAGAWAQQEIYSIYTASRQGGLALADIDGDGRSDLYCGNYWVRSPESFELPWRIFAINLHHAEPEAANFLLAGWPGLLWSIQRERAGQNLRLFTRPADPRQLWPESAGPRLESPRALLAVGEAEAVIAGGGELLRWPGGARKAAGQPVAALAGWEGGVAAAGGEFVSRWRLQPRR